MESSGVRASMRKLDSAVHDVRCMLRNVRWALPEQTLIEKPPKPDELTVGMYVAANLAGATASATSGAASTASLPKVPLLGADSLSKSAGGMGASGHTPGKMFHRAVITSTDAATGSVSVLCDDGRQLELSSSQLRLPKPEAANNLAAGTKVHALFGEWHPGVVPSESLAEPTVRATPTIQHAPLHPTRAAPSNTCGTPSRHPHVALPRATPPNTWHSLAPLPRSTPTLPKRQS